MGLLSGAPAAASLRGTASPALHQRIMTKNVDYDLLLTASVWEAKKDWQRRKSGEASTLPRRSPVLGHRLASFNYGALFFVWVSFVVFATEPTPTVSHYQLDSQCAQPKFEPVLFMISFFLAGRFSADGIKLTGFLSILLLLALSQTLRKMGLAFYAQSLGFF